MNRSLFSYLLIPFVLLLLVGCKQAKYVEEGSFLLKKNKVKFPTETKKGVKMVGSHPLLDVAQMQELIHPAKNRSLKLFFYNRISPEKHIEQVERKEEKFRKKNERRKTRENEINNKRIDKAESSGDSLYRHKVIHKRNVKLGWRDWVRTNMGQPPVMLDTIKGQENQTTGVYFTKKKFFIATDADTLSYKEKTDSVQISKIKEQLRIYMVKKGFHSASVSDTIILKKRRKAIVEYYINAGEPTRIRKALIDSASFSHAMLIGYTDMKEELDSIILSGNLLDQDVLELERIRFSKYSRDQSAMFGFNKNYIGFLVDTTVGDLLADVTIFIKPKILKDPSDPEGKKQIQMGHYVYRVKDVTFYMHNPDEKSFDDYAAYKKRCEEYGLEGVRDSKNRFYLLDTLIIKAKGTFIYNEIPFLEPELLDKQNFLEIDMSSDTINPYKKYYKEYYVERSYRTMSNLGVFSSISPRIEVDPENPLGSNVIVSYDLMPVKKQSFLFEPRLANTNGILGMQLEIGYTNRNLFRTAGQLQVSFIGGMESQPLIVGQEGEESKKRAIWEINTFEWGPKITYTVPRLALMPKSVQNSSGFKRKYPKTVFDLNVNFQKRVEFQRTLSEFGFAWNFQQDKTQKWEVYLLKLNYVKLDKKDFFQDKLLLLNDPFLLNSYTDHLTTVFSALYYYNTINSNRRKRKHIKHLHNVIARIDISGKMLTPLIYNGLTAVGFTKVEKDANGLKNVFGVPYTEFVKVDLQYVASQYINKKHKMVYRVMAGVGFASGNSPSLPYEQAFFAGGSNDIRAFEARTMAPGSVKTYADTNSTLTQIGDTRFEANIEWRFEMTSLLDGAFFVDAGNIWNIRKDTISGLAPSVLKATSFNEIALGVGYGIRADLDFLIIRFDLSFALHNPHLPAGERWFLTDKTEYKTYFETSPDTGKIIKYESPHGLRINFGIGYPF